MFQYTDPVAGTGFNKAISVLFTSEEALLNRAEAYIMKMNEDPAALDKALEDMNLYAANLFSAGFKSMTEASIIQMGYGDLPRLLRNSTQFKLGKTSPNSQQTHNPKKKLPAAPTTRSKRAARRRACFRRSSSCVATSSSTKACAGSTPVASASRSTATCWMKTPKPSCKSPIRSATRTARPIRAAPCSSRADVIAAGLTPNPRK